VLTRFRYWLSLHTIFRFYLTIYIF